MVGSVRRVRPRQSRGGNPADGRKVKGATIHWVDAATAVDAEVRLYDNLFSDADPDAGGKDFLECLNPNSLEVLTGCKVEACSGRAPKPPPHFQFMRQGYFCVDNKDSKPGASGVQPERLPEGQLQAEKIIFIAKKPRRVHGGALLISAYPDF